MKNTSLIDPSRCGIVKNNQGAYVSKNEAYALAQTVLRMSINEIYARHGQLFNVGEVNDIHYQKYNWYRETNKHVVEWDEFNDIEKTNLRFLISIEEEYGYR